MSSGWAVASPICGSNGRATGGVGFDATHEKFSGCQPVDVSFPKRFSLLSSALLIQLLPSESEMMLQLSALMPFLDPSTGRVTFGTGA